MKKLYIGLSLLVAGLAAVSLFVLNNGDKANSAPQKTSIRLKWLDQAQFAGFYWAKEEGLYAAAGADVSLFPGGPDISPMQMVVNGTNDFGVIGADQVLLAREKGIPVVALAVIYQDSPVAIASLKSSHITKPKDLEGKKVAVAYGKDEEMVYKAMLKNAGVDRNKISEVALNFGLSQIAVGETDSQIVYENNEPVLLKQQGHDVDLIKPRDYGVKFYADTLFTTEKMINEHPELVKAVTAATVEGWKQAFANQGRAVEIILKQNKTLNAEHQTEAMALNKVLIFNNGNIGHSDMTRWKTMEDILIDQGLMKKRVDLNKIFTNRFLQ
jgi:ABC-type nitrate/sulfonate/bicarbonate transport system substrate-binding protein